jgi:hypothetical protein
MMMISAGVPIAGVLYLTNSQAMQPVRSQVAVAGICCLLSLYGCSNLTEQASVHVRSAGLDPAGLAVVASARMADSFFWSSRLANLP